jgi:hypothetical protein
VSGNRVLRRMIIHEGRKGQEAKGYCRMRMEWAGHAARMGEMRIAYKILFGELEQNRPLRKPRRI